jgi:hypothetical protein
MFNGQTPWLEVKIGAETLPRTEITNVSFALISYELSATGQQITLSTDFGTLFDITDPSNPVAIVGSQVFNTDANGEVKVSQQAAATSGVATVLALCPGACPAEAEVAFLLSAPVITGFTPGEESVEVDFDAPANEGADAITNYEYSLDDGANWAAFAPEQAASPVTVSGLTGGESYHLQLRAINGAETGEASDSFEVYPCFNPTVGGEIAADQTLCSGDTPAIFQSIASASNFVGTLEYQWQLTNVSSTASFDDWSNIGTNTETYTHTGTLTQTTWFRRLARVDCTEDWSGAASSNMVEITIDPPGPLTRVNIRAERAEGGEVKFIATAINGGDNPIYEWYKSDANGTVLLKKGPENFIDSTCKSGDEHWVEMTSSIPCTEPAVASNAMCTY